MWGVAVFLGLQLFAFAAYHPGVFFVILPFFVSFAFFVVATFVAASDRAGFRGCPPSTDAG
jgi:hypothetical protein